MKLLHEVENFGGTDADNDDILIQAFEDHEAYGDPRSGIVNHPNRPDDPKYILRLIGQVITVSLETQRIIATLPSMNFPA